MYRSRAELNNYARKLMKGIARRQSLAGDASDEGTAASARMYTDVMNYLRTAARPEGGDYSMAFDRFLRAENRPDGALDQFRRVQAGIALDNRDAVVSSSQEENP